MKKFLVLLSLVLCSCTQISEYRFKKTVESWREESLRKIDVEECESKGGKVEGVCMFGLPMCLIEYTDGGKLCESSLECLGECRSQNSQLKIGTKASGQCTQDNDPCGCWAQIEHGEVTETICAD